MAPCYFASIVTYLLHLLENLLNSNMLILESRMRFEETKTAVTAMDASDNEDNDNEGIFYENYNKGEGGGGIVGVKLYQGNNTGYQIVSVKSGDWHGIKIVGGVDRYIIWELGNHCSFVGGGGGGSGRK